MATDEQKDGGAREREAREVKRLAEEDRLRELALKKAEKEDERRERQEQLDRLRAEEEARTEERERRQSQGMMISLASRAMAGRSKKSLLVILMFIALILIGVPYIVYKLGYLTFLWSILAYVGLQILFIFIIYKGFSDSDRSSKFIAIAFLIWLVDMIPQLPQVPFLSSISRFLGPPYAGFEFDFQSMLHINWVAILTSAVFLIILTIGMFSDTVRKKWFVIPFYLAILLAINKVLLPYLNLGFRLPTYANYVALGLIVVTLALAYFFRDRIQTQDPLDFPTFLFMALVISFFSVNNGWIWNFRALAHVIFVMFFGLFYIRKNEPENPSSWHLWIPLLLIADFYLYNFLWIFSGKLEGLQFVPILVLATVLYCMDKSESNYATTSFIFIIIIVIVAIIPTYAVNADTIPFTAKRGASFSDFATQFSNKIKDIVESRLDVATAGLYRGNVEKNRYESLGVYFKNIRAADPRFYTNEPITVWGTIRSKTYQDAVIINFSCYRWKDGRKVRADRIIPDIIFPIFTLEEVDTECTFVPSKLSGNKISSGTNTVTFSAEYNFGTDAYLKAYFIDRDRFRAYARENLNPLDVLGIKDKTPVSVSTNGPVEIGMGTGPLVTVSEGYSIKPTIGISLLNRQEIFDKDKNVISKWDGKIKNITELVLLVPPGIQLKRGDGDPLDENGCSSEDFDKGLCPCNMPFKPYTLFNCQDTCMEQVNDPCEQACRASNPSSPDSCIKECGEVSKKCDDECFNIFKSDENTGDYKAYALDVGSIQFKDLNKDIDKHRTFQCRYEPSKGVLGTEPIATRYFRVRARYNYLLENSVSINVEIPPDESKTTVPSSLFSIAADIQPGNNLYFTDLTPEIINAIASVESRFRHCCEDATRTKAWNCVESGEKDCTQEKIINSDTSIGIMQVKYDTAKAKAEVDQLVGQYCEGKTIYNYDCNVKVGVAILKNKYDKFKDGCKATSEFQSGDTKTYKTLINGCKEGVSSTGIRYDSYQGIDAAIRGYNGWGRDYRFDVDYVEKVKRAAQTIQGKDIIDPSTLGSITRNGKGMIDPVTEQSEEEEIPLGP